MVTILTVLHISVSVFLVIIVLLQHGKGADMGATFGGGSGQTVFGTEGPLPLLNKITTGSAVLFMVTSVALAYYSANMSKGSIMQDVAPPPPIEQQVEVPPSTVDMPVSRANTEGDQTQDNSANATFPGEASTAPVPVTEPAPVSETQGDQTQENSANATFPGEASTAPVPVTEPAPVNEKEAEPAEQSK